jgi:hypothetical protein
MFEKYADKLTQEANELKTKIERERREAKRLSTSMLTSPPIPALSESRTDGVVVASEQSKANTELEQKLQNTENARAEAMRQLSDMHQSYVAM